MLQYSGGVVERRAWVLVSLVSSVVFSIFGTGRYRKNETNITWWHTCNISGQIVRKGRESLLPEGICFKVSKEIRTDVATGPKKFLDWVERKVGGKKEKNTH